MSYKVYTTNTFVLESKEVGEADMSYTLFTEDLGILFARAQGMRRPPSKRRGMLERFSFTTVELVRGKESWRVTSAYSGQVHANIFSYPYIYYGLSEFFMHFSRLLVDNAKEKILFKEISKLYHGLRSYQYTEEESLLLFQYMKYRMLSVLGYIPLLVGLNEPKSLAPEGLHILLSHKGALTKLLGQGMHESQL